MNGSPSEPRSDGDHFTSRPITGARHAARHAQFRRRRLVAILLALSLIGGVALLATAIVPDDRSHTGRPPTTDPTHVAVAATAIPAVESGLLPWSLAAPLSREVVLPAGGSSLVVAGGLAANNATSSRIYTLDTTTGDETTLGALAAGTHDAAGARLGAHDVVFGGGSATTVATVQQFPSPAIAPGATAGVGAGPGPGGLPAPPGTVITSQTATSTAPVQLSASDVGALPKPRSDSVAATIGGTSYIVGGYDGGVGDPAVLATTDGTHFSAIAALPVPVRYGAVAAAAGKIYVFGGESAGGPNAGQPVDSIQVVDPHARTAHLVGHLAHPVEGACAFVLSGHLYVAGGAGPGSTALDTVWAYDPSKQTLVDAGVLPVATSYAAAAVIANRAWILGGEINGIPQASVEMVEPNKAFGMAGSPGAGSPFFGDRLLVADRGNNRILLLDDTNQVIWTYPSAYAAPPPGGFYFPDDAFFAKSGTEIISNQEQNETIVIIAFPSGKVLWQYGHPKMPGFAPGFLHEPDDAYLLKNGQVTVADANACRILFINPDKTVAKQIGTSNVCRHQPPDFLGTPNGDTPLANGDVLVSEINGSWVTEYNPSGKLAWTVHLNVHYPSDPQQLGPDLYLLSDYASPGAIDEFNREGQLLYRYQPDSGLGRLNQPSLTELLPSGVFLTNDDFRSRMVAVDPATGALVWQYGTPDTPGTAPGQLNIPDGFDLLLPNGTTPTHLATN